MNIALNIVSKMHTSLFPKDIDIGEVSSWILFFIDLAGFRTGRVWKIYRQIIFSHDQEKEKTKDSKKDRNLWF